MDRNPVYFRGRGRGHRLKIESKHLDADKGLLRDQDSTLKESCDASDLTVGNHLSTEATDEQSANVDIQNEEVLIHLLTSFSDNIGNGSSSNCSETLGSTHDFIMNSMKAESAVCLICIETIEIRDPVWSCKGCFCIFHIDCIQKWIRSGVQQHTALSEENFPKRDLPWFCPKCRHEYKKSDCPAQYMCFCGKVSNPPVDVWLVPHSCGQTCGNDLKPHCGHKCLLLCHPGPCPPCPKTVKVPCPCGKNPHQVKRCGTEVLSCGKPCGRMYPCRHLTCPLICHKGDCPPCTRASAQACFCKRASESRPCSSPEWRCTSVCGKPLTCGHHVCKKVCHSGECGSCPNSGERACPCGKSVYDLPCTEDVPLCLDTCNKLLACGLHSCAELCHRGHCGTCRHTTIKRCRCGNKSKEIPCYKEYICDVKCSRMRDCGKHLCKRKCCDGNCPKCEQTCGKFLSCRNHKCESQCHAGLCYPCRLTTNLYCYCRQASVTLPCGRERSTKPPTCKQPCQIPTDCDHLHRRPHKCHFGRCPPCRLTCGKALHGCTHTCSATCHASIPTKVQTKLNMERAGPWEPKSEVKFALMRHPCPPCPQLVTAECLGKHEATSVLCSALKLYSCGRPCNVGLPCGNHTCQLECHDVAVYHKGGLESVSCDSSCTFPRPDGCTHECLERCHPGDCPPCRQRMRMRCHCKVTLLHVECNEWTGADDATKRALKSCSSHCPKDMICGHRCLQLCHIGSCSDFSECTRKVNVKCPCKRKRKTFPCNEVYGRVSTLKCDVLCEEHIKKRNKVCQSAEVKEQEEIEKQQLEELEAFERKRLGKKRKPRKQKLTENTESIWEKNKTFILTVILMLVAAAALIVSVMYLS